MICDQELKGSTGTLEISEPPGQKIEEIKQYMWQRLERYSDPFLKPDDFKRWEKYVNHLISEGKSFETIVEEIRFEKMGDQKTLQEELEAMKYRRHAQEMDEALERAKEKLRKKEIENIAKENGEKQDETLEKAAMARLERAKEKVRKKEIAAIAKAEDESNLSLTESRLCAECRDEYKYKLCKKCGFSFCRECFDKHNCIFDTAEENKEETSLTSTQETKTEEITPMESLYRYVDIKKIKIGDNRRVVDEAKVKELAESIEEIGLLHPVTITRDRTLISGLHRIRAFELLNRTEIPYRIMLLNHLQAELAEIDENLIRNEIHYTDSGNYLARRKKIYEELYPRTKKGAINQYTKVLKPESDDSKNTSSFVEDTARKTGKSKTVIKEELQISNNVIPEAKEILKEKKLPKQKALKVARMTPEEQKNLMEQVKQGKDIDEVLGGEKPQEQVKEEPQRGSHSQYFSDTFILPEGIKEQEPVPEFPEEEPEIEKEKDFQKKYQEERERKDRQYKENKSKEYINLVKKIVKDYSKYDGFLNIPDYINELSGGNHKNDIYGLYREIAQKIREINTAIISIDTLFKNSER